MLEMAGDERGRKRPRRIHRRAANRPGKHRFERDDRADGDSRRDAFFLRAGRDIENREHEEKGQDGFENERLRFRTGGQSRSEQLVFWKKKSQQPLARIAPAIWLAI